jgi:hypothetical protein
MRVEDGIGTAAPSGCVANFDQGHEDVRRPVTGSGRKQIELLCQ